MSKYNEEMKDYGIRSSNILLPKKDKNFYRWAVVACDQYTSEKRYWFEVSELVEDSPSTNNIIYPEAYLEESEEDKNKRIASINKTMDEYVSSNLFTEYNDCFILVERTTESGTRYGLMSSLDLEHYSYAVDSKSLIRATEGTILDRIPPRKEIRKNASLELPHIMVLISDEKRQIIEVLRDKKESLEVVYDTKLMMGGGHAKGYLVNSEEDLALIAKGFGNLYSSLDKENPLLFAMGDGNHSLATAKSCWEDIKLSLNDEERENHPARYALVEIENIFDEALFFEPIHRVLFKSTNDYFFTLLDDLAEEIEITKALNPSDMIQKINENDGLQHFGFIDKDDYLVVSLTNPNHSIAAGTLQTLIDKMLNDKMGEVDYIHGVDVTERLAKEDNNIGIILPDVSKDTFFASIIKDRSFPRKTFSIGHANEKRFYMEAKKIK